MEPVTDATVYVVDDDAAVREALAWLLRSRRLLSECYRNGEEFEPLCLFNIQKKGTGKNPIPLLSVGYRKDVFMFFVDRVELSEFLMKSFALLTMKSKPTVLMKFSATQKMKLNPPIAAAISYAESVFHIAKQYFTHPQGWI